MQHLDLDYEDLGETLITERAAMDLHDLRVVLVTSDPVVARRVQRVFSPMGARLAIIPDWGHVSLAEVRGIDPQLVLLEPEADLRSRAHANRRLAEESRLRWAMVDRVPKNLEAQPGVDRLVELASVALGADRQLQAEVLLSHSVFLAPVDAIGPGRLLRTLALGGGCHDVHYSVEEIEAALSIADGRILSATWTEHGPQENQLEGVPALTAFTALRQGEVLVLPSEANPDGEGLGRLDDLLERAANAELSWVATRVATGRYLFPPPGIESYREGDLPEASKTKRAKAERITVNVLPIAGSSTIPGIAAPPSALEMPRMPRKQGPKPIIDSVARPDDVAVRSILSLNTPAPRSEAPAREDALVDDYQDEEMSSLRLDVEVELEVEVEVEVENEIESDVGSEATAPPADRPREQAEDPLLLSTSVPAPVSVWPSEPAPVSAADSMRPAMSPVVIPQRRFWPWALAALALLGLMAGGGVVAAIGPSAISAYAENPGDIFAEIENLDFDAEGLNLGFGSEGEPEDEARPAAAPLSPESAPIAAPTTIDPADGVTAEGAEMVFELGEARLRQAADPTARDRSSRRRARRLLAEAHGAATAGEAAERYEEVLARDPRNAAAMSGMARAKMAMHDYAAAATWAERAALARPRHAASWGLLGDALRRSGDLEAARRAYDRASALDPSTAPPAVNQASVPPAVDRAPTAEAEPEAQVAAEAEPELAQTSAPTAAMAPTPPDHPGRLVPTTPAGPPDQLAPRSAGALPPAL